MIYIEPKNYIEKTLREKYEITWIIRKLNRQITNKETTPTMLIGPGRWETIGPSLGVRINFAEINDISVIVEITYEGGSLMLELSFWTHFSNNLVESDIFYITLFGQKQDVNFNDKPLSEMQNLLADFVPEIEKSKTWLKYMKIAKKTFNLSVMWYLKKLFVFSHKTLLLSKTHLPCRKICYRKQNLPHCYKTKWQYEEIWKLKTNCNTADNMHLTST